MATALYRRYRPEAFSEMIGQAHVTEPLMTALRTGRIGHAYLFSGPRGCGKTTSARILARCLNCAEGPTDTPCGTCPSCVELSRDGGGSLDVVEIDAASHGGVDDARELRERAVFAPARDRYKIFIIDEAHMVTSGGFNALLKIVEEPPPHVKFIFATTEPDKVIGTIRSRTHHYPFRLIAPGTLIDYVQQLCDSEGIEVEAGVLPLVVRSGGGSVRDTLSILDQLIAGSEEGRVSLERATGLLGFTSTELLDDAITALGAGDSARAFGATDRVVQTGQDPRRFVEDLLERLRDLIVISATTVQGASAVFRGVPDDQLQRMFEQAQAFAPGQLSRIADTVSEALDHMTGATAPRLHLELMIARALVEQARSGSAQGPSPAQAHGGAQGHGVAQGHGGAQGHGVAPAPAPARPAPASAPSAPASTQVPPAAAPTAAPAAASAPANPGAGPAPAAAASAPSAVPAADAGVDVIATLKSAREFLNGGGAPKAPMVPLGGHAPAEQKSSTGATAPSANSGSGAEDRSAGATVPATGPVDGSGAAAPAPEANAPSAGPGIGAAPAPEPVEGSGVIDSSTPPVGIDELRELWPELLEELLESDREAWNAVKNVQPLALEGDTLTVGLTSRSDLEVFKTSGAAPLREVIGAAVGISVKYVPRQLPPGSAPTVSETTASEPHDAEPSPTAEPSQAPESVASNASEAKADPAASTEDPSDSAPPVFAPAPSAGAAPSVEPAPGVEPVTRVEPDADPAPAPRSAAEPDPSLPPDEPSDPDDQDDPYGDPGFDAAPEPRQAQAPDRQPDSKPVEVQAPPTQSDPPKKPSTVGFAAALAAQAEQAAATPQLESTRYGESVVRELLGARFIEERPLPQNEE